MTSTSKIAVVSGAARGIGLGVTTDLARHGWVVLAGDLEPPAVRPLEAGPGSITPVEMDVTDAASIDSVMDLALDRYGSLDLVVNNAGIQIHSPFEAFPWSDWEAVLDVNLHGVLRCMQSAGRRMLDAGRGAVVNVTSVAAERGAPGRGAYVASKAAVNALTRTAAVEWASRGVRVNAVGPGYVKTDLVQRQVAAGQIPISHIEQATPAGRLATVEEIAKAIRFLGSEEASFITGQVLYVDGGFLVDYAVPSKKVG